MAEQKRDYYEVLGVEKMLMTQRLRRHTESSPKIPS